MATKPTLALIPSGYGTNKVYSVLPSDGSGDFTFGRTGTATRINKDKLIEDVGSNIPRIDYTDSGCPSLLLEPQRTNLYPYSQYIGSGGLIVYAAGTQTHTITNNYSISPDGTQNAIRFQATVGSSSSDRVVLRDLLSTSTVNNTVSVYAKSNTTSNYTMVFHYEGGTRDTFIVTPKWQRFSYTEVSTSVNFVGVELGGSTTSLEADVSLWGFQFEVGSYPTSIIPTTGTSVTRIAETATGSGNADTFNDSEGVLFAEISALANDGVYKLISLNNGLTNNTLFFGYSSNEGEIHGSIISGGAVQFAFNYSLGFDVKLNIKIALKYKQDDFALWLNGFKIITDLSGNTPIGINKLSYKLGNNTFPFYGKTKDLRVYNTALTDLELETLVSFTSFNAMALNFNYTIY